MIIKGGAAGNVGFWTHHLLRDDTNDEVRLIEVKDLVADSLGAALREMQAIARQSRSRGNFMYQANINPPADADLTQAQMREAVRRLERKLGLDGHQRVIVEHVKHGRRHWHIIWNRVDVETLKVADITGNYAIHVQTARELEQLFGLPPTPSPDGKRRNAKKLWEHRAEEQSGLSREQVIEELTRCWQETSTGTEFRSAIEKLGYILARGDRRDYCVMDRSGMVHSLARRLRGISTDDVRRRLTDIHPASLPSVAEARVCQRAENPAWRGKGSQRIRRAQRNLAGAKRESFARRRARRRVTPSSPKPGRGLISFRAAQAMLRRPTPASPVSLSGKLRMSRFTPKAMFRDAAVKAAKRRLAVAPAASDQAVKEPMALRPEGALHMDPSVFGRANAAHDAEMAKWQALIDAAAVDPSLTPEQRAAAVTALRSRQRLEATAVRRKIIAEEKQRVRAARRRQQRFAQPQDHKR